MSIFDKTRAAIVAHFQTNWPAAQAASGCAIGLSAVQMDNHKFTQPVAAPWGRLSIARGTRAPAAIGGAKLRSLGIVYLQIFLPLESGTAEADQAADAFASVFDMRSIPVTGTTSYAVMETASLESTGDRDGYRQYNASIPFRADENL
jgi:hypothetical protein